MFSPAEIHEVLDTIRYHYSMMIFMSMGSEVLSDDDKLLLEKNGVNIEAIKLEYPAYMRMFLLGRLTAILRDPQNKQLTHQDFKRYIDRGQFIPLSERERAEYEISREMTYGHLKGLANRVVDETRNKILEQNKMHLISETISEGVKNRKSVESIVSDLGHRTGEWTRDWKRIVMTEMQNIYNQGRSATIYTKYGEDQLVWKQVFPLACRHCIRLYTTHGIGSEPRIFKLSDLIANGNNIGRLVDDWLPIIGATHPYCFIDPRTPIFTSTGWKQISKIEKNDLVLTHKGRFRRVLNLLFRTVNTKDIKQYFDITVKLQDGRFIKLRKITFGHPVLREDSWVGVENLRVGNNIQILYDRCSNSLCQEDVPVFYTLLKNSTQSTQYCSRICANSATAKIQWQNPRNRICVSKASRSQMKKKYEKMTLEERRNLTNNARKVTSLMFKNGTHPFNSKETKIKANRINEKKCSFIELKLRYFLDQLGIKYKTDYYIERDELKSNGQKKMYFPDIFIEDLNIVIEADGINWHEDIEADKKRDQDIKRLIGADTFRFTEDEIRNQGEKVYKELERIIKNHRGEYSFKSAEIVEIKSHFYKLDAAIKLYNFSVEEDESYIVNGFVVHNCRCDLRTVFKGQKWNSVTGTFEYTGERERKVERHSKIKVTVGDKVFLV